MAVALLSALPVAADERALVCFGNEPSWSVVLGGGDTARLVLPEQTDIDYQGAETRLDPLGERMWRGAPRGGTGGDLVVFLRDADCSDGMSDQTHPVVARVSLPDGRMLAGCCRITAAAAEASPAAVAALAVPIEGPVWQLTQLRGQKDKALAALPTPITARFSDGRLQAFAGCNQLSGAYRVEGDRLRLEALAGTMMACPPPVMAVETAFKAALSGVFRVAVVDGRLTLMGESDGEPALVFTATPPPRIEGVTWEVTGYNNGRQAVVSPRIGTTLTRVLPERRRRRQRRLQHLPRRRTRATASASPSARRRRRASTCDGKGVMEQEREFLAALESATVWDIDTRHARRPPRRRRAGAHGARAGGEVGNWRLDGPTPGGRRSVGACWVSDPASFNRRRRSGALQRHRGCGLQRVTARAAESGQAAAGVSSMR